MKKKNKSLFFCGQWNFDHGGPKKVDMFAFHPNLALGNMMQGSASFRVLEMRIQMTQLCEEKTLFQHFVTAGNCYKIRPDDDDKWEKELFCVDDIGILDVIRKKTKLWRLFPQVELLDQPLGITL